MTKDSRLSLRVDGTLVEQIEQEASRRGLVLPSGSPNVSAMVLLIIREWMKLQKHHSSDD